MAMDLEASERFTRLWIASQPAVSAFVHAAVPDLHRAEDLIQEVAATALRKFPEYDPVGSKNSSIASQIRGNL